MTSAERFIDFRAFFLQIKGRTTLFHSLVHLKGRVELWDLWGCQSLTNDFRGYYGSELLLQKMHLKALPSGYQIALKF